MDIVTREFKFSEYVEQIKDAQTKNKIKEAVASQDIKEEDAVLVRKSYSTKKPEILEGERADISYINTASVDRDGEIVHPGGAILTEYVKNPIVLGWHFYGAIPQGKCMWINRDEKGLRAKTRYVSAVANPEAERVYQYLKEGFPLGKSVGFIPKEIIEADEFKEKEKELSSMGYKPKDLKDARRVYKSWVLLEYSNTPTPCNPDALTIAVGKGLITEEEAKTYQDDIVEDQIKVGETVHSEFDDPEIKDKPDAEPSPDCLQSEEIAKDKIVNTWATSDEECAECKSPLPDKEDGVDAECAECGAVEVEKQAAEDTEGKGKALPIIGEAVLKVKADVEEKELWNKSLSPSFKAAVMRSAEIPSNVPTTFDNEIYKKYLGCRVKDLYINHFYIPSPLIGSYLAGFKEILKDYTLKDTRNFHWSGAEFPLTYEIIQLNSEKSDDFLIEGSCFYKDGDVPFICEVHPLWSGMVLGVITHNNRRQWNKSLLEKTHEWVKENNFLKGEKFALSGEFLESGDDDWDSLILPSETKSKIIKSVNYLEKKKKDANTRGLLMIGVPGTGKTKSGRVLLNELDSTFIWVSTRDFRYGTTHAIHLAFKMARDLSPSVLFIEDIDAGIVGSAVDLLKTEMDGLRQHKGTLTVLTSNYPEKLPDALLDRPGRFHHIINFTPPGRAQRKEMLTTWAGAIDETTLKDILDRTEGYSGAHMKEIVDYAKMIADEDEMDIGKALLLSLDNLAKQRDLIQEIRGETKTAKPEQPTELPEEPVEEKQFVYVHNIPQKKVEPEKPLNPTITTEQATELLSSVGTLMEDKLKESDAIGRGAIYFEDIPEDEKEK